MSKKIGGWLVGMGALLALQPALASRPLSLAIGQQVRGEITSASPINVSDGTRSQQYLLELAADQAVRFEVSGALDATVSVLRDGELVARSGERGNGNVLTVRAPSKGRYLVAVSGKDARSFGPFALNSTPIQAYSGGPLQPGQSINDVTDSARDLVLQIDEAGLYEIRMASTDFDTQLSLSGDGVDASNDDANGTDSMITTYLQPGQYQLRADGFSGRMGGQYTLDVARRTLPEGVAIAADGPLQPGERVRALYVGQPASYTLSVPAGKLLRVDMESNDFDSVLQLTGNGVDISDDDSGDRLNARLTTVLPAGDYQLHPKGFGNATGVFTLKAELSDAPADAGGGRLVVGQARNARLYGSVDTYQVRIERAGSYVIDMNSDEIDSGLELLSEGGASLAEDDDGGSGLNSRITEVLQPGTYTIRAKAMYSTSSGGGYRIVINRR